MTDTPPTDPPTTDTPTGTPPTDPTMTETPDTFNDLGLRPELLGALAGLGYEEPTPIQSQAIPPLLAGRDLLGQAATGTGKTAAFALPVLERLERGRSAKGPMALILVPTRELAIQVSEAIHRYGRELGARVLPIYGGQPIGRQLRALDAGIDVVVATPGRALDHIGRATLRLDDLSMIVLDEADEMLDMGFAEDIEAILSGAPAAHQTVLFSATLPSRIDAIARRHLHDPVQVRIRVDETAAGEAPLVRQVAYLLQRSHKAAALGRILDVESPAATLVFCRTRDEVDRLTETLNGRGYRAEALHGGMNQEQRDRVMGRLRQGSAELLVATDVAARGLDVDQLTHVVNYDVPASPEAYVHRIGRVGRAGREGVAITLAEPREHRMLKSIERMTKRPISIEKVPTVADLRARRLEVTRAAIRDDILEGDLDGFRVVVEALADEFDLMEVALAAVKLAHDAKGPANDDVDIPEATTRVDSRGSQFSRSREASNDRSGPHARSAGRPERRGSRPTEGMTKLFIGAGRETGIRPQDLVGAIAGESSLSGKQIGSIDIAPRFSLVEVPDHAADEVIEALRATRIKGKRTTVRRERDSS